MIIPKSSRRILLILCLTQIPVLPAFSQDRQSPILIPAGEFSSIITWTETTYDDFADGESEGAQVYGGSIQFPHPLVKTVEDYRDDAVIRFRDFNAKGNYLRTWKANGMYTFANMDRIMKA